MDTIDKINAKKGRFGIADILIILVVLALIGGGLWYYFGAIVLDYGESASISYEVRLTGVRDEFADRIKPETDKVYDSVYGEYIGIVTGVRVEQYTEQLIDKNTGELVSAPKPGYCNIYITIDASAEYKDNVYYINDTEMRVGEAVYLRLASFCGQGYCTALVAHEGGDAK